MQLEMADFTQGQNVLSLILAHSFHYVKKTSSTKPEVHLPSEDDQTTVTGIVYGKTGEI